MLRARSRRRLLPVTFVLAAGLVSLPADISAPKVRAVKPSVLNGGSDASLPRIYTSPPKTSTPPVTRPARRAPAAFPWKKGITSTVFWVGEKPSGRNTTPNHASSWDRTWQVSFGGYDDPHPDNRAGYRPKKFVPQQNPFYVALPYNDVAGYGRTKPEASKVIPWFKERFVRPGLSVCKGQWIAIRHRGRVCYAQWEDCGPFETDDWMYVFGNSRPRNQENNQVGLDVSPAVRDYLKLKSGEACDWKFISVDEVPSGPWALYGDNNHFVLAQRQLPKDRQADFERLRQQRDAWLQKEVGSYSGR